MAAKVMTAAIVTLVTLSVTGQAWRHLLQRGPYRPFVRVFDLDDERNIPTAYQAAALGCCALLLWIIGRRELAARARFRWHWIGLALIFALLSVDEAVRIHERIPGAWASATARYLRQVGGSLFAHRWVVYGIPFAALVGLAYLPFVLRLPPRVRNRVMAGGMLFVGGALGMEMLASLWTKTHGLNNFPYAMLATTEELLEMTGVAVFLYSLLLYLQGPRPTPAIWDEHAEVEAAERVDLRHVATS